MASFGEALVSAFNGTYGTVSQGMLRAEQTRALRDETDANQRQREEVRASQIRNGILNPDGTTNDPGAPAPGATPGGGMSPPAAQPQAPMAGLDAPTSAAPAPAPAPTPAARPGAAAPAPAATGRAPVQGALTPTEKAELDALRRRFGRPQ